MKKKQSWLDKKLSDIESWGPLTLFRHLKDTFDTKMSTERDIIFKYGTYNYEGSNLETHDKFVAAVNVAWDREFKNLYDQLKEKA